MSWRRWMRRGGGAEGRPPSDTRSRVRPPSSRRPMCPIPTGAHGSQSSLAALDADRSIGSTGARWRVWVQVGTSKSRLDTTLPSVTSRRQLCRPHRGKHLGLLQHGERRPRAMTAQRARPAKVLLWRSNVGMLLWRSNARKPSLIRHGSPYHEWKVVGAAGFEPTTTSPPDWCATRLRHAPTNRQSITWTIGAQPPCDAQPPSRASRRQGPSAFDSRPLA